MDEAARCDRIALINESKILGIDTPQGIVDSFDEPLYAIAGDNPFGLLVEARRESSIKNCYPFGEAHHIVTTPDFDATRFVEGLGNMGFTNVSVVPTEPTIEDVFIKLMRNE